MKRIVTKSIVLTLVIGAVNAPPASAAYVDPSTGGMLFQLLAVLFASLTAILLFFSAQIRMAFARVKRLARRVFNRQVVEASQTKQPATQD